MVLASSTITRYDLSAPMSEFDLAMNKQGYIGTKVLRPRTVNVQAADVGKIPLKELLQMHETKRAAGAGYKRGDFKLDKYSYSTEEYGWEEPLDDRQLRIYSSIIDAEQVHASRATAFVCDEYERDAAAAVYDTALWTGDLTTVLGTPWSNHAAATPIDDIIAAREKIVLKSGLEPNALTLNRFQFNHLTNCDQILERVKYTKEATQAEMAQAIAAVLGIDELIVAGGLKNTANPKQVAAIERIWSNSYSMLARVAKTDDPQEPSIGRTFMWDGDGPGAVGTEESIAVVVEEYREESVRGGVIRSRTDRSIEIMYKEAGHLLSNVLA